MGDLGLNVFLSFVLLALGVIASFAVRKTITAVFGGDELKALRKQAIRLEESLSLGFGFRHDIDRCSEHADVLRAIIRFAPSHAHYDMAEAAMTLHYARGFGAKLSLTGDDLTVDHLEVYEVMVRGWKERCHVKNSVEMERLKNREWVSMVKNTALAMEHLGEYPMILSIVRDRGVTDVREALEIAKTMQSSDAPVLSGGML